MKTSTQKIESPKFQNTLIIPNIWKKEISELTSWEQKEKIKERPNFMNENQAKNYLESNNLITWKLKWNAYKHHHFQYWLYNENWKYIKDIHLEYDKPWKLLNKKTLDNCIRQIQMEISITKTFWVIAKKNIAPSIKNWHIKRIKDNYIDDWWKNINIQFIHNWIKTNMNKTMEDFLRLIKINTHWNYNSDNINIYYERKDTKEIEEDYLGTYKKIKITKIIVKLKEKK